jgi:hypothetical protein
VPLCPPLSPPLVTPPDIDDRFERLVLLELSDSRNSEGGCGLRDGRTPARVDCLLGVLEVEGKELKDGLRWTAFEAPAGIEAVFSAGVGVAAPGGRWKAAEAISAAYWARRLKKRILVSRGDGRAEGMPISLIKLPPRGLDGSI